MFFFLVGYFISFVVVVVVCYCLGFEIIKTEDDLLDGLLVCFSHCWMERLEHRVYRIISPSTTFCLFKEPALPSSSFATDQSGRHMH